MEQEELKSILEDVVSNNVTWIAQGKVASYIPELSKMPPDYLGIYMIDIEGNEVGAGDTDVRFTIQSISKIITLALCMKLVRTSRIYQKVWVEPTANAFNSLTNLETMSDIPNNPFINSGAIAVCDLIVNDVTFEEVLDFTRKLCSDEEIALDESVFNSEKLTGDRNRSIAYLLKSKGIVENDVDRVLDLYFKMCSLSVTARDLASMAVTLANDGKSIASGEQLIPPHESRRIKTLMLTCGMYDGSGEFALNVGVPSKSGVGGGVLSCVNKRYGIGIFGPSLDEKGNSKAGCMCLRELSKKLKLHIFL